MKTTLTLGAVLTALCLAPGVAAQLPPVFIPAGNPQTADKIRLGKVLFFDEQLSSTDTVACATCHLPDAGGSDVRAGTKVNPGPDGLVGTGDDIAGSPGVPLCNADGTYAKSATFGFHAQVTGRIAPTTINAAYNNLFQFWDGRAGFTFNDPLTGLPVLPSLASLETQASGPPTSNAEMGHQGRDWQNIADKLTTRRPLALATNIPNGPPQNLDSWIGNQSYPDLFNLVWGDPTVTPARIIMSIASYERTLVSDQTPFDLGTLSPLEQQGLAVFNDMNRARCVVCHVAPTLRNNTFMYIGVRPQAEDIGREMVTGNPADKGKVKTPGLRNVALHKAFFHSGTWKTIDEVIEFYERGGDFDLANVDPLMMGINPPLDRTPGGEFDALKAFLTTGLTDPRVVNKTPPFDRPTLYTEGPNVPQLIGTGVAGTGGFVPEIVAIEPPLLGNPDFNFTIAQGLGGAELFLGFGGTQGTGTLVAGVPFWIGAPLLFFPLGPLQGVGAGEGYFTANLVLPPDPALNGGTLYWQGIMLDPATPGGLSATPGLATTFFLGR